VPAITSRQNPIVARFRAIARGDRADRLLLDGAHLIEEALAAGVSVLEAAMTGNADEVAALADRLRKHAVPLSTVTPAVMRALSPVRSSSPIVAIAEACRAEGPRVYGGTPLVVIAVDVQDAGNVGAIARVAEAGGATGVVCAGACANPFGWKALRGSMGSALRLPVSVHRESELAILEARRYGCRIVAAVPRGGTPLYDVDLRVPSAILVGGEGAGLSSSNLAAADQLVAIPMKEGVDSLNVAVSAALIVYEARRQRTYAV
jgi:RNA methyltransferase, TrmH family